MISYNNSEVVQLLRQYDMFSNSLNLVKTINERNMIIKQLTKIEQKIIKITNEIYEEEYKKLVNRKTGLLDEEKDRLNTLIELVNQRLAYVEKRCNSHYQLTGEVFDVEDVLGATLIENFEERLRIIDKYKKNTLLEKELNEDIKSLSNKINLASKTIEINNSLNKELEDKFIERLDLAFDKLGFYDYLNYKEDIKNAFSEIEESLKMAQSNLEFSKNNERDMFNDCQDMLIEIKQEYLKYKEKMSLLKLMEIFNKDVNNYDELLNKRKEVNDLFKFIRNEEFNSMVYEMVESQFNTISIEIQDINTYDDLISEKERKINALAQIEKENNSDKFKNVLNELLENERIKQEKILEEKRKIEEEEKKRRLELEKKKQEEILKKQKIIEEARKKEIEKRTKELLEQQQNSILQNRKNEFSFRTMKDITEAKEEKENEKTPEMEKQEVVLEEKKVDIEKELFDEFNNGYQKFELNLDKISKKDINEEKEEDVVSTVEPLVLDDIPENDKNDTFFGEKIDIDNKLPDMSIDEYMKNYREDNDDKIEDLFLDDTLFPNIPM